MDHNVTRAYETLTPKDRIIVDTMILSLYEKDIEGAKLAKDYMSQLRRATDLELQLRSLEAGS